MLMAGHSKASIARRLGRHRNSILAWTKKPEFVRLLHERLDERHAEVRLRRLHATTRAADRLARVADQALSQAEADPRDRVAMRAVRGWLRAWRQLRAEERLDLA